MKKILKEFILKQFYLFAKISCRISPYTIGPLLAKIEYRAITKRNLNLGNPQNLIEKIVWMQFHTDTSLWTICADKYSVRSYVEEKGLAHILPKLYGSWEKVVDINWDLLPQKFVMKTNNSCGQNLIVRNKHELDIDNAKIKLDKWLKERYGHQNAQLHYLRIKPRIIAEELLEDPSLPKGTNLIDYKIVCINGEPESILVVSDRQHNEYKVSFFDLEWNNISEKALNKDSNHYGNISVPRPKNLETMIEYARILSAPFPQVRVDFYDINGKIYFGELTFTTGYGYRSFEYSEYLGSKINLSKIKRIR